METLMNIAPGRPQTERRKWHIILLDGIASGEVKKIAFKLPADILRCNGFIFSGNVAGNAAKNHALGRVSLFINNRRSQPLNYLVQSKPFNLIKRKYETLKLEEEISGGSYVQGYYQDFGFAVSFPYKVRIYLDCIRNTDSNSKSNG